MAREEFSKYLGEWDKKSAQYDLKNYLMENASDVLVDKKINTQKTLNGALKYCAKKAVSSKVDNVSVITNEVVYGWVIHYFEEEELNFESAKPIANVKTSNEVEDEEIEDTPEIVNKPVVKETKKDIKPKVEKTKKEENIGYKQLSLEDMLGAF